MTRVVLPTGGASECYVCEVGLFLARYTIPSSTIWLPHTMLAYFVNGTYYKKKGKDSIVNQIYLKGDDSIKDIKT